MINWIRIAFILLLSISILIGSIHLGISFQQYLFSVFLFLLKLDNNSWLFQNWKLPPTPITCQYYLFELKNVANFSRGLKPIIEEHGPFIFKVKIKRSVIKWRTETVIYKEQLFYEFDSNNSIPLDKNELIVLNYPLMVVNYLMQNAIKKQKSFLLTILKPWFKNVLPSLSNAVGERIIVTRTARQLLLGHRIAFFQHIKNLIKPLKMFGISLPTKINLSNFTFGFGPHMSGKYSHLNEHYRQTENGHLFDGLYKINGKRNIAGYKAPCNSINGSSGAFFGINLPGSRLNEINFFNYQVCRRIKFVKNNSIASNFHSNLLYTTDVAMFDMNVQDNRCYCLARKLSTCQGQSSISPCTNYDSITVSFPHFYNSTNRQKEINGLKPDYSKHIGFLHLEPYLGIPINVSVRFQFNIQIAPIPGAKFPLLSLPMFWVNQSASLKNEHRFWLSSTGYLFNYGKYFILLLTIIVETILLAILLSNLNQSHSIVGS